MPKPKKVYDCGHRGTSRECDRCEQAKRLEKKAGSETDTAKRDSMLLEAHRLRQEAKVSVPEQQRN